MKRFILIAILAVGLMFGGGKLAIVVGASQFLAQLKQDLVPVGAFQYGNVDTSFFEAKIDVSRPKFKHFALKQDFDAEHIRFQFDGALSIISNMFGGLGANLGGLSGIHVLGLTSDLPDDAFYEAVSTDLPVPLKLWFGFLSCDGRSSPNQESFAAAGIDRFFGEVYVSLAPGTSEVNIDADGFGRVSLEADLLGAAAGLNDANITALSYVENGYFKRLSQTCVRDASANEAADDSAQNLSSSILDGWSRALAANGLRIGEGARATLESYIDNGGILRLELGESTAAINGGQYGWQPAEFVSSVRLKANDDSFVELGLQRYIAAPVVETTDLTIPTLQPRYLLLEDPAELTTLIDRRLQVALLNEKQYEGTLRALDEHTIEIVPLNGDGNISYTLERPEISSIQVWVE